MSDPKFTTVTELRDKLTALIGEGKGDLLVGWIDRYDHDDNGSPTGVPSMASDVIVYRCASGTERVFLV